MLGLLELKILNATIDESGPSLPPVPASDRQEGFVIAAYSRDDRSHQGILGYVGRNGIILTNRVAVSGWDDADEAHSVAEQKAEFFGLTELRVEPR